MKLLIIDDDENIAGFLRTRLAHYGFVTDIANDGESGIRLSRTNAYDLIILDLNLPDMRGGAVIDCLKELPHVPPILLVSVVGDAMSKVDLINEGADDYLVKPFIFEELLARTRALLRRCERRIPDVLTVDDVSLDPFAQRVWRAGAVVPLTRKEFDILEYLLRHSGRVVSRSELFEHVWDSSADPCSTAIDTHLGNLRRKLGQPDVIETVHGMGCLVRCPTFL
jgi:two-component system OmpR family response regulator